MSDVVATIGSLRLYRTARNIISVLTSEVKWRANHKQRDFEPKKKARKKFKQNSKSSYNDLNNDLSAV